MLTMTGRWLRRWPLGLLRRLRADERGQVLMLSALLLLPMLGFAGLALDVGTLTKTRWELQHAADAAALAGVQELPACNGPAVAKAQEWADNGAYAATTVEATVEGAACDTIRVMLRADVPMSFMRLFGIDTRETYGTATARIASITSTRHFMPWGLTTGSDCLDTSSPPQPKVGTTCVLKVAKGDHEGALDFNGGGGAGYRQHIIDGTASTAFGIGSTVAVLEGNKVGPTKQGIDGRLALEPSSSDGMSCDSNGNGRDDFDEVFSARGVTNGPSYAVRRACSESPRLMTVPIVDQIDSSSSTILGWATIYLDDDCSGSGCAKSAQGEVTGRIVDAVWTDPDGELGPYQPGQPAAWFLLQ